MVAGTTAGTTHNSLRRITGSAAANRGRGLDLVTIDAEKPVEHAAIVPFARVLLILIHFFCLSAGLSFIYVDESLSVEVHPPKQQLGKSDASEALLTGEDNALLALWVDMSKSAIYYRLSVDRGKTFNSQQTLVEGSGFIYGPQISTTTGFVHVCWYGRPSQRDEIFYANVNLATGRASIPLGLSRSSDPVQYCSISASHDVAVISWTKEVSKENKALVIAYSVDRGQTFSAPLELARTEASDAFSASLATLPGKIFVAWSQATGKNTSEINFFSGAVPLAKVRRPQTLSHPAARATGPYVAASGNNVVVAWSELDLKVSASKDGGATFSVPIGLLDPHDIPYPFTDKNILGGSPRLTAAQNNFYLLSDGRVLGPNWQQVYFAASSDGGAKFSALRLMSAFNIYASGPQLFLTPDQKVVIVWQEIGQEVDFMIVRISPVKSQEFQNEIRMSVKPIRGQRHYGVSVLVNDTTAFFLWVEGIPENIAAPIWLQAVPLQGMTDKAR
jgi:hypothetical protein